MVNHLTIKIAGHAGEGIKISALILGRAFLSLGYYVFGYNEYPSLIRGGLNCYQLDVGVDKIFSQTKNRDILICLNEESFNILAKELRANTWVIYDSDKITLDKKKTPAELIGLPFSSLCKEASASTLMVNTAALASVWAFLNLKIETFIKSLLKAFKNKPQVASLNQKVSLLAYRYVKNNFPTKIKEFSLPQKLKKKVFLSGNEAVCLGALAGGMQFFSAYPMTPATSILHYFAQIANKAKIVVKHAEDEISAITMALGASFAGAKSMTATSGSGLCLMAESISFSGISELPLVIINSSRPGPAAGMPTWTAQADLQFVLRIGHDDFPKIVLAPGDALEAFKLTRAAFSLAEEYQLPVLILIDKFLSESDYSLVFLKESYENPTQQIKKELKKSYLGLFPRYYRPTPFKLPWRTLPGFKNGIYCCNSYEHDEFGFSTEDKIIRKKMVLNRLGKLKKFSQKIWRQPLYGDKKSKLGVISWGSNKGPILEALKTYSSFSFLHLNFIWPFPKEKIKKFIKSHDKVICFEVNASGQLTQLIRQETGFKIKPILKFDGRPFWPEEIISHIKFYKKMHPCLI